MNVHELLKYTENIFRYFNKNLNFDDIRQLFRHFFGMKKTTTLSLLNKYIIKNEQLQYFRRLIKRRLSNEPIAYVIGRKSFWKHDFIVNDSVLIPRPETEIVIISLIKKFHNNHNIRVLDLGTGSGSIAVSLNHEFINSEILATDISLSALFITKKNIQLLKNSNITLLHGNWFDPIPSNKIFDIIIANPPYVSTHDWYQLTNNILIFEPQIALTDYNNGLSHYHHIIQKASKHLKPQGLLFLEIGVNQKKPVSKLLQRHNFSISIKLDITDVPRIIIAQLLKS